MNQEAAKQKLKKLIDDFRNNEDAYKKHIGAERLHA